MYNILGAVGVGLSCGVPLKSIVAGIELGELRCAHVFCVLDHLMGLFWF